MTDAINIETTDAEIAVRAVWHTPVVQCEPIDDTRSATSGQDDGAGTS